MALIFDIETNGLLVEKNNIPPMTKIHCIMIHDTKMHTLYKYDPDNTAISEAIKRLNAGDTIIGHNIIGFDIPAIQKIFPKFKPKGEVIDTYVWAACVFPNIRDTDFALFKNGLLPARLIGSYSLEAFGYRLGVFKGDFAKQTDWAKWTPEMSTYCQQDVNVTFKLINRLQQKKTSWQQVKLEQRVLEILNRQQAHGILFDVEAAQTLYIELNDKRERLREDIQKSFPSFFKRKGKLFTPKRDNKKLSYVAGATCQKIELVEFNPSSSIHISKMLMRKYSWIPVEFAEKEVVPLEMQYLYNQLKISSQNVPKIDDEILKRLPYPECKPLVEFQMLQKRCAMLSEGKQAWLRHYNEKTHRIHGAINQFGAYTRRCIHFNPNLSQVVAGHHPYGKECRSLFTVPKGKYLVGCDADGLEARCKAHYITPYDDSAFVKTILEGEKSAGTDVHSLNRGYLELASRDVAKTWYYAYLYGAGNAYLGILAMTDKDYKDYKGDPAKLGSKHRAMFSKKFKGLKDLTNAVQKQVKLRSPKMWLKSLDGGKIPVKAVYTAINNLLQGAGAVIMKKALVITNDLLCAKGLTPVIDFVQILFMHDEFQFECRTKKIAEIVGRCAEDSIRLAGEHFNFRCPLSGSSLIGNNWYDTH